MIFVDTWKEFLRKVVQRVLGKIIFGIFSFYTPFDDKIKLFIKEEMIKLYKSPNPYDRFLFLKVLGNDKIYEMTKKHLAIEETPFNLRRKVLRSILEMDHVINFSLMHLMTMGDRGQDLLWWKIL